MTDLSERTEATELPQYIRLTNLADLLDLPVPTLRRLADDPASHFPKWVRTGRDRIVKVDDVTQWLRTRSMDPAAEKHLAEMRARRAEAIARRRSSSVSGRSGGRSRAS